MHRRTLWLMMVVTAGSTLVCGAIKSTRAQSVDSAVLPTNYVDSGYAGDDTTASRLPTAGDGTVSSLTALEGGTNARIAALEAKIAELNASLQNAPDKPKRYIVGSNTSLLGKFTNDGATFTSPNGDFRWKMRGLVQLDAVGFQGAQGNGPGGTGLPGTPGGAGTQDSTTFRRLRVGAEGTMYETIDWVWELDAAFALQNVDPATGATPITGLRSVGTVGGVAGAAAQNQGGNTVNAIQPTTIFMTFTQLPIVGNIRVGNQQDWFSLEHIESARFLDFMERAPIMDVFSGANNNGYTPGLSMFNMTPNKRAALEAGIYKNNVYDSGYPYSIGTNALTYNVRGTCTPFYDEPSDGRYLLHMGVGSEYRTLNTEEASYTNGDNVRLRSRGDMRNFSSTLDPNFADTGNFFAKNQALLCPEIAFMWGPLLIQAEYVWSQFNGARTTNLASGTALGTVNFNGGYVEALYFLTGENRQYNRQSGVFNRVVPFENYGIARGAGCCGWGAWQVGVRYDWINLNSGGIRGGISQNCTVGLNWFLNPNARFQVNYIAAFFNNDGVSNGTNGLGSPLVNAGNVNTGFLQGSMFTGTGLVNCLGARMDFNF